MEDILGKRGVHMQEAHAAMIQLLEGRELLGLDRPLGHERKARAR
jgi:hypothetical protein